MSLFYSLPQSLNESSGKSHRLLASKRIWHFFSGFENWVAFSFVVSTGSVVICTAPDAPSSGRGRPLSLYPLMCVWSRDTDFAEVWRCGTERVRQSLVSTDSPRAGGNSINPPHISPCPCVFVISNNTVSIQQLIQLTRIQIINEHAFSLFLKRGCELAHNEPGEHPGFFTPSAEC